MNQSITILAIKQIKDEMADGEGGEEEEDIQHIML
jgi:hypothetical protein